MNVFLTAESNSDYSVSAFAYKIGSEDIVIQSHIGWTVLGAHLKGLLAASNFIIDRKLFVGKSFKVITANHFIFDMIDGEKLKFWAQMGWEVPTANLKVLLPQLKELYYHDCFYRERGVWWSVAKEVTNKEAEEFSIVSESCKTFLGG